MQCSSGATLPSVHELGDEAELRLVLHEQEGAVAGQQVRVRGQSHGLHLLQQSVLHIAAQALQVDYLQSNFHLHTYSCPHEGRAGGMEGMGWHIPSAPAGTTRRRTLSPATPMKYFHDRATRASDSC